MVGNTCTPRGSKSASRIITYERSGSPVKPFQMARQVGLRRRGKLTTRLRAFENVIAMDGLLVTSHDSSRRKSMVTNIASKWFLVPGLDFHAERAVLKAV